MSQVGAFGKMHVETGPGRDPSECPQVENSREIQIEPSAEELPAYGSRNTTERRSRNTSTVLLTRLCLSHCSEQKARPSLCLVDMMMGRALSRKSKAVTRILSRSSTLSSHCTENTVPFTKAFPSLFHWGHW